jgi:2OG-Fe(II) oxygenase superfamily
MRYQPGSVGVSPHRDGKRNIHLIAILTTDGTASFRLCADRDGTLIEQWTTTPGSLVLMRSPAPDKPDDRPFHTVSGPIDRPRYSITYRMNTKLPAT